MSPFINKVWETSRRPRLLGLLANALSPLPGSNVFSKNPDVCAIWTVFGGFL